MKWRYPAAAAAVGALAVLGVAQARLADGARQHARAAAAYAEVQGRRAGPIGADLAIVQEPPAQPPDAAPGLPSPTVEEPKEPARPPEIVPDFPPATRAEPEEEAAVGEPAPEEGPAPVIAEDRPDMPSGSDLRREVDPVVREQPVADAPMPPADNPPRARARRPAEGRPPVAPQPARPAANDRPEAPSPSPMRRARALESPRPDGGERRIRSVPDEQASSTLMPLPAPGGADPFSLPRVLATPATVYGTPAAAYGTPEEDRLGADARAIARRLADAESGTASPADANIDQAREDLRALVNQQFEIRQGRYAEEVKALEARVEKLKAMVRKREDNRSAIVEKRIDQLMIEAQGMGW